MYKLILLPVGVVLIFAVTLANCDIHSIQKREVFGVHQRRITFGMCFNMKYFLLKSEKGFNMIKNDQCLN